MRTTCTVCACVLSNNTTELCACLGFTKRTITLKTILVHQLFLPCFSFHTSGIFQIWYGHFFFSSDWFACIKKYAWIRFVASSYISKEWSHEWLSMDAVRFRLAGASICGRGLKPIALRWRMPSTLAYHSNVNDEKITLCASSFITGLKHCITFW